MPTDLNPSAYVHTLSPFAIQFTQSFGIRWYGLSYLTGFLLAYLVMRTLAKRGLSPLPVTAVGDLVFTLAMGTIIGGRLGYCIFYDPSLLTRFSSSAPFWGALAINEGGMASHGGMVGILLAALLFARKHSISALHLCDLAALCGPLGVFFGRLANFVNGELVGRACQSTIAWAVKFPQDILAWPTSEPERLVTLDPVVTALGQSGEEWRRGFGWSRDAWNTVHTTLDSIVGAVQHGNSAVIDTLGPRLTARHPSQLYEALGEGVVLFLILLFAWAKPRKPGVITGIFFIAYALIRIVCEQFRMPDLQIGFQALGLTRGQYLSAIIGCFGFAVLYFARRREGATIGGWLKSDTGTI